MLVAALLSRLSVTYSSSGSGRVWGCTTRPSQQASGESQLNRYDYDSRLEEQEGLAAEPKPCVDAVFPVSIVAVVSLEVNYRSIAGALSSPEGPVTREPRPELPSRRRTKGMGP